MKEPLLISFGQRIRDLRIDRKLNQEELAKLTGFHRNYIGMIERGERNPALKNIQIFAEKFEISLSELFNDNLFMKEVESGKK